MSERRTWGLTFAYIAGLLVAVSIVSVLSYRAGAKEARRNRSAYRSHDWTVQTRCYACDADANGQEAGDWCPKRRRDQ